MKKHTKNVCFKIVGYPEWWEDSKPKNHKATTVVGIPQTTSSSSYDTRREEETKSQVVHGRVVVTHGGEKREENTSPGKSDQWIFYCGAADTMTHNHHDFDSLSTPVKTHIETGSGELVAVQRGIKKLSLCSCTIIKITFCKSSYKGAKLCGSHVF